jgi:hypothetical protein
MDKFGPDLEMKTGMMSRSVGDGPGYLHNAL